VVVLALLTASCGDDGFGDGGGADSDSDSDTDSDTDGGTDTSTGTASDTGTGTGADCAESVAEVDLEAWVRERAFAPCGATADPCATTVVDVVTGPSGEVRGVQLASGSLTDSVLDCIDDALAGVCFPDEPNRSIPVPLCD
jgi:hypothetical protein